MRGVPNRALLWFGTDNITQINADNNLPGLKPDISDNNPGNTSGRYPGKSENSPGY
jgi:hypothetical protein